MALLLALTTGLSGCEALINNVCSGSADPKQCRQNVVVSGAIIGLIIIAAVAIGVAASDDGDGAEGGPPPAV